MGLPASILAFGFGQMWIGIGLALGTAANWILCAKRLRTFSKAADPTPSHRYNTASSIYRSVFMESVARFSFSMCGRNKH